MPTDLTFNFFLAATIENNCQLLACNLQDRNYSNLTFLNNTENSLYRNHKSH